MLRRQAVSVESDNILTNCRGSQTTLQTPDFESVPRAHLKTAVHLPPSVPGEEPGRVAAPLDPETVGCLAGAYKRRT